MKKISIMQPTFFPWLGYFELINKVDSFVFLDDVEISKQSWQTRNFFLSNEQHNWISIPIRGSSSNTIIKAEINRYALFLRKLLKFTQQNFKHNDLVGINKLIHQLLNQQEELNLADFNIKLIKWFIYLFDIKTTIYRSSQLFDSVDTVDRVHMKDEKIIDIVQKISGNHYVAAAGSKNYMEKFGLKNYPFKVEFFNYPNAKRISIFYDGYGFENVLESINRLGIEKIRKELFPKS
jgi:hypothetical protein